MPRATRTFRIFISSTFSDLKEERNALQRHVFPRLRALALSHGCRFQAIDLRWGVSTEAGLNQQSMRICLDEIRRCQSISPRPNFIILLGDRYGWRPLPYEIPEAELERWIKYVCAEDRDLLEQWYWKDENALPPVYILQPRKNEYAEPKVWEPVESRMHEILEHAARKAGLTSAELVKYIASATEQEIIRGALNVDNAKEHVFCFFRSIENLPENKSAEGFIDLDPDGTVDNSARIQLERLKNQGLGKTLSGNILQYKAEWTESGITHDHLESFCHDVEGRLTEALLREISLLNMQSPIEKEMDGHRSFAKERAAIFQGRTEYLSAISEYIGNHDQRPMIIFGASGTGKSALIARATEKIPANQTKNTILRFIGVTADSSDIRLLLKSLCSQITGMYGYSQPIPDDYNTLAELFKSLLELPAESKPLTIFLDAVDQLFLEGDTCYFSWIPDILPPTVKMVITTLPDECFRHITRKWAAANLLELKPMAEKDGEALLNAYLQNAGRTLRVAQMQEVLSKFNRCPLPMYMKLAVSEAIRWHSFQPPVRLGPDIPGLIKQILNRLCDQTNHGGLLVSKCLRFIAVARHGLSEDEILDLLSRDYALLKDYESRFYHKLPDLRLPVVLWSRLHFDLESFLSERAADGSVLISFYHRQFQSVVCDMFCSGEEEKDAHRHLSEYFSGEALWYDKHDVRTANIRKISELPYQLTKAAMSAQLQEILTDFNFLEAKCSCDVYDLITDYDRIGAGRCMLPERGGHISKEVTEFADFVRKNAHTFQMLPAAVFQQAANCPDHTAPAMKAAHLLSAGGYSRPWLKWINKPHTEDPLLMTISGPSTIARACAWSPDGKYILSWHESRLLSDRLSNFNMWDGRTGRLISTMRSAEGFIHGLAFSPDGSKFAAQYEHQLQIINAETGRIEYGFQYDRERIECFSYSPDNKMLAIAYGMYIDIYDTESYQQRCSLRHKDHVECFGFSHDSGSIISGSQTYCQEDFNLGYPKRAFLTLWDVHHRKRRAEIDGRKIGGRPSKCFFTPDDRKIVTSINLNNGAKVVLLDKETMKPLRELTESGVNYSSPDGSEFAFELGGYVWIYNTSDFSLRTVLKGNGGSLTSFAYSPDGLKVATSTADKMIHIWYTGDLQITDSTNKPIPSDWVYSVASRRAIASTVIGYSVWDMDSGKQIIHTEMDFAYRSKIVSLLADGKCAVVNRRNGLFLLNTYTGEIEKCYFDVGLDENQIAIFSSDVSPDGLRLITLVPDPVMWDIATGDGKPLGDDEKYAWCKFSPDGRRIALFTCENHDVKRDHIFIKSSDDNAFSLLDAESGKHEISVPAYSSQKLWFTPDGTCLYTIYHSRFSIWSAHSGVLYKDMICMDETYAIAAVSPDGRKAVVFKGESPSSPRETWLLDIVHGAKPIGRLSESWSRDNLANDFTSDGKLVISMHAEGLLSLYDTTSAQLLALFHTGCNKSSSFVHAFNRNTIITGDIAGNTYIMQLVNFPTDIPRTTPIRQYHFEERSWEESPKIDCEWCGNRFKPNPSVLATIARWKECLSGNEPPCLFLPDEAFSNPGLVCSCPSCHGNIRCNPYIYDHGQN